MGCTFILSRNVLKLFIAFSLLLFDVTYNLKKILKSKLDDAASLDDNLPKFQPNQNTSLKCTILNPL